jgi:hypothetical protein
MRQGSLLPEPRGIVFESRGNYLADPRNREVPWFVSGPQPMPLALRWMFADRSGDHALGHARPALPTTGHVPDRRQRHVKRHTDDGAAAFVICGFVW